MLMERSSGEGVDVGAILEMAYGRGHWEGAKHMGRTDSRPLSLPDSLSVEMKIGLW